MRIGHAVFYNLEGARQKYLRTLEFYPLVAACLSFGCFIGYAVKTPIYSKLYRELGKSILLGATFGYIPSYFSHQKYLGVVDESYEIVKQKFEANPKIIENVENHDNSSLHIKNFGLSAWNDADTMDDFDMDA